MAERLVLTGEQRAALDAYFAAIASGGARVLSNASQARRVIAEAATVDEPAQQQPTTPSDSIYPTT